MASCAPTSAIGDLGIIHHSANYVIIENVPGLQSVDDSHGPFAKFLKLLTKLGYWYCYKVIYACHYGVPQRRRRLVLVASRLGPISFPKPTHGPSVKKALPTVWEAIGHLPRIKAGRSHPKILNHRAANLSDLNLRRIQATKSGGTRTQWPAGLVLDCHESHAGHTDVYGRMAKNLPSAALTTRCISLSNGRFGHPTQHRAISVREAECEGGPRELARQLLAHRLDVVRGRRMVRLEADEDVASSTPMVPELWPILSTMPSS